MNEPKETIVLEAFLHIGDRIVAQNSKSTLEYRQADKPDGTMGTVIGFYRYQTAYGPNQIRENIQPGIYEGNGVSYVRWDDGTTGRLNCHDACFVDESLNETRRADTAYREAFNTLYRVGELPELRYMIGNVINTKVRRGIGGDFKQIIGKITSIDYLRAKEFCDDGVTPYPIYTVNFEDEGYSQSLRESEIYAVIDHGNYWAWNNDKTKLRFKDIREEASFYISIGMSEQLRNPRTGDYSWSIEEALTAIKEGTGDVISTTGSFFGSNPFPIVFRFIGLPDLSQRLQTKTLEGFSEDSKGENA